MKKSTTCRPELCVNTSVKVKISISNEEGNFHEVAKRILSKYKPAQSMQSVTFGSHYFHMFTRNEITFMCLAADSLGKELALKFLNDLYEGYTPEFRNNAASYAKNIKLLIDKFQQP